MVTAEPEDIPAMSGTAKVVGFVFGAPCLPRRPFHTDRGYGIAYDHEVGPQHGRRAAYGRPTCGVFRACREARPDIINKEMR